MAIIQNILNVDGPYIDKNGNFGVGTNSPQQKLEVNGNVLATQFIKSGGTSTQFLKADGSVDSNSYLTSFDITTQTDPKYLRSDTSDTMNGSLTVTSDSIGNRIGAKDKIYNPDRSDATYPIIKINNAATANDTNGDTIISGYYPIIFKTDLGHTRARITRGGDFQWYTGTAGSVGMHWDNADSRLGIGNTNPEVDLQIGNNDGTRRILLYGANSQTVSSELIFADSSGDTSVHKYGAGFRFDSANNVLSLRSWYDGTGTADISLVDFYRNVSTVDTPIQFRYDSSFDGNVGIGTTSPSAPLHVKGVAIDNVGLTVLENDYVGGGVYFPALSAINTRGNHSYGVVAEFRTNTSTDSDKPSILFYGEQSATSWQVGQVTSTSWGPSNGFGIGYRASNDPNGFTAWPTDYFTISTGGDVTIPEGKLTINISSGTIISTGAATDAFGYNPSYGHYIWGNGGKYIYGNGLFYDGGTVRDLIHSGNISSQSVSYAGNAGQLDGLDSTEFEQYVRHTVDMSNTSTYAEDTYYPVTIPVSNETTIKVEVRLNSGSTPSWSTHGSGFSINLVWSVNGAGWGTVYVSRRIHKWTERWTNQTICGGITQMENSSYEVVYLRGGGKYWIYTSRQTTVTPRSSSYTVNSQTVAPTTSKVNKVWDAADGFGFGVKNLNVRNTITMYQSTSNAEAVYITTNSRGGGTNDADMRLGNSNNGDVLTIHNDQVGIGTTSPTKTLDVAGDGRFRGSNLDVGYGLSTSEATFTIGQGRLGNGYSYIDLIGDTTYTDYGLRIIRNNGGANTVSSITHRGTGNFQLQATDSASILFKTYSAERMRITSGGNVGIGTTSPSGKLDVNGQIVLSSDTEHYIEKDTTSLVTGSAVETTTISGRNIDLYAYDDVNLRAGTGDKITFHAGGGEKMRINSSGNVGLAKTSLSGTNRLEITATGNYDLATGGNDTGGILINGGATTGVGNYTGGIGFGFGTGTVGLAGVQEGGDSDFLGMAFFTHPTGTGNAASEEKMRLSAVGNLGIGTTSPTDKLDVRGSFRVNHNDTYNQGLLNKYVSTYVTTTEFGRVATPSVLELTYNIYGTEQAILNRKYANADLLIQVEGNTHTTFYRTGEVCIGYTAPQYSHKLSVNGNAMFGATSGNDKGISIYHDANSGGYGRIRFYQGTSNNSTIHAFSSAWSTGTENSRGCINIAGQYGVTIGDWNNPDALILKGGNTHFQRDVIAYSTTISDAKFKDEVETIPNALDKVKALRGVSYVWNNGSRKGKKDLGVIAQEVEKVLPEIVHEHEMPLMGTGDEKHKTVDYEKMVGVLIEAMKEQQEQIDELKRRLDGSTN